MDGVFVGRMSPFHRGHELVVRTMVHACGIERSLLVIGSANHPCSLRHFFSYTERRDFVKTLFPELRVIGLPDYPTDDEWVLALDDLLVLAGMTPTSVTFFGGCEEDIRFFIERGRSTRILNRFDGTTPKISATEVRDALIHARPLEELLSASICEKVRSTFQVNWERFKRM